MLANAKKLMVAAAVVIPLCVGCDNASTAHVAPTVPVKGKVTYKGIALSKGVVTFEPMDIGREAEGQIQPDGTFTLSSFKANDGAVVGSHRVAITGVGKVLPQRYQSPMSSKIEVEVVEGKSEYNIDLK